MKDSMIDEIFKHHPPTPQQLDLYDVVRNQLKDFAHWIQVHVPESREKSLAITSLQEAMMWANSAIAIHTPPAPDPTKAFPGSGDPSGETELPLPVPVAAHPGT